MKLISKEEIDNTREQLKVSLDVLRQNYIPGAIIAPRGTKIPNCTTVCMKVTPEDLEIFSLGLYICDAVEKIMNNEYDTKDVLYLLEAESKLALYLKGSIGKALPMGIELPDYYFLRVVSLMISRIKDNLEIKVKM